MRKFAGLLLVLCSSTLLGQNAPPPLGTPPMPITAYTGRYLDSTQPSGVTKFTWRALKTIVMPTVDRIYFINSEANHGGIAVYRLSTFLDTLATPYVTTDGGVMIRPPLAIIGRDWGNSSDMPYVVDFDVDDRGYVYATTNDGLQITDSEGNLLTKQPRIVQPLQLADDDDQHVLQHVFGERRIADHAREVSQQRRRDVGQQRIERLPIARLGLQHERALTRSAIHHR